MMKGKGRTTNSKETKLFFLTDDAKKPGFVGDHMDSYEGFEGELRRSLNKPLNERMKELLSRIEAGPELYLGNDVNIRCLFHFLNGWQMTAPENRDDGEASLNEKMNAFLALKYNDSDSLNWGRPADPSRRRRSFSQ